MYAASTTEQNPSPRHVGTPPATNTAGVAVRFYERNGFVRDDNLAISAGTRLRF